MKTWNKHWATCDKYLSYIKFKIKLSKSDFYPSSMLWLTIYFWSVKIFAQNKTISVLVVVFGSFLNSGYLPRIFFITKNKTKTKNRTKGRSQIKVLAGKQIEAQKRLSK